MLTKDEVQKALPPNLKSAATQELTDKINQASTDPILAENIRDNFISYTGVLQDGKFKTENYLDAVKYVSYKLMGMTNFDAYVKTFPNRYSALVAKGTTKKDIASYVVAYHKGKLVNLIMEQTLIPSWVLNQDAYQRAINTQVDLMTNASSEKVRSDAANSILTHLGKPKDTLPAVNINVGENQHMVELKGALLKLADQQRTLIENGVSAKDLAATPLIEGNSKVVDR